MKITRKQKEQEQEKQQYIKSGRDFSSEDAFYKWLEDATKGELVSQNEVLKEMIEIDGTPEKILQGFFD